MKRTLSKPLIVCDIDNCLTDARWRNPMAPKGEAARHNDNWIDHQSQAHRDPLLYVNAAMVKAMVTAARAELAFLSSRHETTRVATNDQLADLSFYGYELILRHMTDNRYPWEMKADYLERKISRNPGRDVILIEDCQTTIDFVRDLGIIDNLTVVRLYPPTKVKQP